MDTEAESRPAKVANKDIPLLRDILPTMQLVCETEKRLEWERDRIGSVGQRLSGMPGSRTPHGLEDAIARLDDTERKHEESVRQYLKELREAENVLNGIESRSMRAFVLMKYVAGLPDAAIRRELNMSEYGFERARKV